MAFTFSSIGHFQKLQDEVGDEFVYWGSMPEAVHIVFGTDESGGNSTRTNVSIWPPCTGMQLEYAQDQFDEEKPCGVVDLNDSGYLRFDFHGEWELQAFMENLEALLDKYKEHCRGAGSHDDDLIMEE
jgi:hypothetical protein